MRTKVLFLSMMLLAMSAATGFAESGTCGENLTWTLNNGMLTISGTGAMTDYSHYSPSFAPWYSYPSSTITTVVIEDGVTSIGNYAFYHCTALTEVAIGNSVTSIGSSAFRGCSSLTEITIPNSVTSIGGGAFYGCSDLTSITIPNDVTSIGDFAFSGCSSLTAVTIPNSVTSIGGYAFSGCSSLSAATIPNSVTSIGTNVFSGCTSLRSLTLPLNPLKDFSCFGELFYWTSRTTESADDVTYSVSGYTQNYHYYTNESYLTTKRYRHHYYYVPISLKELTITDESDIKSNFFKNACLTSVSLPRVKSIGLHAFIGCSYLLSFDAAGSSYYATEDGVLFDYGKTKLIQCPAGKQGEYAVPEGVTETESYAFEGCSKLTAIVFPNSIVSFREFTLDGCTGLQTLTLPFSPLNGLGSFGELFHCEQQVHYSTSGYDNYSLSYYTQTRHGYIYGNFEYVYFYYYVPSALTTIHITDAADIKGSFFSGVTRLKTASFPLVKGIGYGAFSGCTALTSVVMDKVENIGEEAFADCSSLVSIHIPGGISDISAKCFSGCKALALLSIPANIMIIQDYAFANCTSLDTVRVFWTTPLDVVKDVAFNGVNCSRVALQVPAGKAGTYRTATVWKNFNILPESSEMPCASPAYSGGVPGSTLVWAVCDSTLKIGGNGSIPSFASDGSPWYSCRSSIKNVEIGADVYGIGNYAFAGCQKLVSVTVPSRVYSMGSYVFANCTALSSVTFQTEVISEMGENEYEYTYIRGINSIGANVFSGCTSLASVTIPETCTGGGIPDAFRGNCLSAIYVSPDHPNYASEDGVLFNKGKTQLLQYPARKAGGSYTIPASVTKIGGYAFDGCTGLNSLAVPNTVREIIGYAFNGCSNLASAVISNSTTSIGMYAFDGCTKLESISLPLNPVKGWTYYFGQLFHTVSRTLSSDSGNDNYSQAGYRQTCHYYSRNSYNDEYNHYYFYVPSSLKTIHITDDTGIPANFFQNTSLETVFMPSVPSIGNNAFSGCNLKKVTTTIVAAAINLPTLEELTITSACTSIPSGVLSACNNLRELTLPFIGTSPDATGGNAVLGTLFGTSSASNAVTQYYEEGSSMKYAIPPTLQKLAVTRPATRIRYGALYNCSMLQELTIASTVTGIEEVALHGCSGITHIYAQRAMPPTAYDGIAYDVDAGCVVHIPNGSLDYYKARPGWMDFFFFDEESEIVIRTQAVPLYGGAINPSSVSCERNESVSFEVIPNAGYTFRGWMEDNILVSASPDYTFTATAPRTLYAVFTPRENADENIQIQASSGSATLSWTAVEDAVNYLLVIYSDESRTEEIARFELDAAGNPVVRSATQTLSCTVPDLNEETRYYYSLTSYNSDNEALTVSAGNFSTVTTGIDDFSANAELRIVPNPVTDFFKVVNDFKDLKNLKVRVTDAGGRTVMQQTVRGEESIFVGHLPAGIYLVRVNDKTFKIIKN
jgi:uncharacterized repeat protein (TIGR02543 family)